MLSLSHGFIKFGFYCMAAGVIAAVVYLFKSKGEKKDEIRSKDLGTN